LSFGAGEPASRVKEAQLVFSSKLKKVRPHASAVTPHGNLRYFFAKKRAAALHFEVYF